MQIARITKRCKGQHRATHISNLGYLWTDEAKLVKDLDRFEMILQAHEYEDSEGKSGTGWLQEFFDFTKDKFQHWVQQLNKLRDQSNE